MGEIAFNETVIAIPVSKTAFNGTVIAILERETSFNGPMVAVAESVVALTRRAVAGLWRYNWFSVRKFF